MNDKIKQLYDLYVSKGLISSVDFETFRNASPDQITKLYNLGKDNGLFETTDVNTFSSAFTGQPVEEPVKKKEPMFMQPQVEAEKEGTAWYSEPTSLVSQEADQVPTEEQFRLPTEEEYAAEQQKAIQAGEVAPTQVAGRETVMPTVQYKESTDLSKKISPFLSERQKQYFEKQKQKEARITQSEFYDPYGNVSPLGNRMVSAQDEDNIKRETELKSISDSFDNFKSSQPTTEIGEDNEAKNFYLYYLKNNKPDEYKYQTERLEYNKNNPLERQKVEVDFIKNGIALKQKAISAKKEEINNLLSDQFFGYKSDINKFENINSQINELKPKIDIIKNELSKYPTDESGNIITNNTNKKKVEKLMSLYNEGLEKYDSLTSEKNELLDSDVGNILKKGYELQEEEKKNYEYVVNLENIIKQSDKYPELRKELIEKATETEAYEKAWGYMPEWVKWSVDLNNGLKRAGTELLKGVAFLPKAFGEKAGYGWTDKFSEWADKTIGNYEESQLPISPNSKNNIFDYEKDANGNPVLDKNGDKIEKTNWNALPYQLGNGAGNLALFIASGSSSLPRIGTFAMGYTMSAKGNYDEAKSNGMNEADAVAYSKYKSNIDAAVELIFPEKKLISPSITKSMAKKTAEYISKGVSVKDAIVKTTKETLGNIIGENVEELTALGSDVVSKLIAEKVTGTDFKVTDGLMNEVKNTVLITSVLTAPFGIVGAKGAKNQIENQSLFIAANKPNDVLKSVESLLKNKVIDENQARSATERIRIASEALKTIPENYSDDKKVSMLSGLVDKKILENSKKNTDPIFHDEINQKINEKNEELKNEMSRPDNGLTLEENTEMNDLTTKKDEGKVLTEQEQNRLNYLTNFTKEYAIQKQAAGQVPVQPTTGVGEKVEEGKPTAEPKVTPTEGVEEAVTTEVKEEVKPTVLANVDATTTALESVPVEEKMDLEFTQEDGTVSPVNGNERMLSDMYHKAMALPEDQRTEPQKQVVSLVEQSLSNEIEVERLERELAKPEVTEGVTPSVGISISNDTEIENLRNTARSKAQEAKTNEEKQSAETKVKVLDIAQKAIKTLKSVLPDFDIVVHDNEDSFNTAMQDVNGVAGSRGNFAYVKGTDGKMTGRIDINLSKANARTVAHEVAHGILTKSFGENTKLFGDFRNRLSRVLKSDVNKELNDFANRYVDPKTGQLLDVNHEEFLAELTGMLERQQASISVSTMQKIAALINEFVSTITGGKFTPFKDTKDTKDIVDFFNTISGAIREGEEVSLEDINTLGLNGQIQSKDVKSKSSLVSGEIKRFPVNPNIKLNENVPLSDFDGKTTNLIESDRMVGGFISDSEGKPMFKFFGGVYYPIITGKWWASRNITKAKAIAENGNKNRDNDGYIYSSPMIGSDKQHMSNNDMLFATIELMKNDVSDPKSKVKKNDVIDSLKSAFNRIDLQNKKSVVKDILKKSNDINSIFNELEFILFQDGDKILGRDGKEILDKDNKPISNFTFEQRLSIIETVLGDPKVKEARFPSAGSITMAAKRFEEPITEKAKAIGDMVVIFRTKGNLEYKESDKNDPFYHKSYPVEIRAVDDKGNPAEIEVYVLDSAYSMKDVLPKLKKSTGGEFSWDEYISKHKKEKLATAQYSRTAKLSSAAGQIKSKSQQPEPTAAPKYVRDISVLITPATVRGFDTRTERIKDMSIKYDKLVKEYAEDKSEEKRIQIKELEDQILNDAKQEIIDEVNKIPGLAVKFEQPRMGLWEGAFEPSFNMTFSVTPQADTKKISDLLVNFGEKYSQDAFILETQSEQHNDFVNGKIRMPLNEEDSNGLANYPQIIYTFAEPISDDKISELSTSLQSNGIDAFSVNNNELKISVLSELTKEQEQTLSKDEQYAEKFRDFESRSDAAENSVGDVLGSNALNGRKVVIKKSYYKGAVNQKSTEPTRQYDRGDILKPFQQGTTEVEALSKEFAALRNKQIEGKKLTTQEQARFDELKKTVQPVVQKTFEANKKIYEQAKREVENIAEESIKDFAATISPFPIKRPERASVKTLNWYSGITENLGDGARVNIVVTDEADADAVFDKINEDNPADDPSLRRINETTDLGYPKRLIEVITPSGVRAEMQVITDKAYLAKDGVKGFTGSKEQVSDAKKELAKIRKRLGWSIPDGLGHYFYEVQRDTNVDQELRDEAKRLSELYYDAFTNEDSKLEASPFMDDVNKFRENVDKADKTNWDEGNTAKAPETLVQYKSKSQVEAFHGSPHDFEKFTTEKIGTGEGAQAFGWGLYFTDLKSIAEDYAKNLSKTNWLYDGKEISNDTYDFLLKQALDKPIKNIDLSKDPNGLKKIAPIVIDKIKNKYIPDYEKIKKDNPSQAYYWDTAISKANKSIDELNNIIQSKNISKKEYKKLYQVTLHEGKTPEQYTWLEWYKPLNDAQKKVILDNLPDNPAKQNKVENLRKNISKNSSDVYKMLSDIFNSDKDASLFLLENGIDGIKYPANSIFLGATSKNAKGFNYVVFDENAVTIKSKSQQPGKDINNVIKRGRAAGVSERAIRTVLKKQGFTDAEIDAAMGAEIGAAKKVTVSEEMLPGFDRMMEQVDGIVTRSRERGANEEKVMENVMRYVEGSKAYQNASDVQKNQIIRDIEKRFGIKQKAAPKVERVLDIKDTKKVTMSEKEALKKQIKDLARGAKNAKEAIRMASDFLSRSVKQLAESGKITVNQAANVIRKFSQVNVLSSESVERFVNYMTKVFADADYANKLSVALDARKSISKLSKNKDKDANLRALGEKFKEIDPSMVENIDEYNDIASLIKESIKGSTFRGAKLMPAQMVNIQSAMEYVSKTMEAQKKKMAEIRAAEIQEMMGVDVSDLSYEQMLQMLESKEPVTKYNEGIIRDTVNKMFDIYSSIIDKMIRDGIDPMTGDSVDMSPADKNLLKRFMAMDTNKLTVKEAISAVDALNNFIVNKSTAKMETVVRQYTGDTNANKLADSGVRSKPLQMYWIKGVGRFFGEQFRTLPSLIENMFKGVMAASKIRDASGITDIINGKAEAETKTNRIVEEYIDKFYKQKANGEDFNTEANVVERGMIAFMSRSVTGTDEQIQQDFNRRKKLIEESIDALSKGSEKEQAKAELYKAAYEKILKDSNSVDEVRKNADKTNIEAVDFWVNKWDSVFNQLADVSENVYNKILDRDINYSPDRFTRLEKAKEKIELSSDQSAFHGNTNTLYKKETGVLMRAERPESLPKDDRGKKPQMYIDLSFDKNNANSMYDAMVDINTAGPIRQVEAFINSEGFDRMIPEVKDAKLLKDRIQLYIRNIRNKNAFDNDEFAAMMKRLNTLSSIGVGQALGGVLQPIKQTIPVSMNTLVNAKGFDIGSIFNQAKMAFIDNSGYSIANRGLESQTQLNSINKLMELAAKSRGEKALKFIEEANKIWLKIFLVKFDVFVARASWMSYYEQSLKKQGIDPKGIDYNTHKLNKEAANYAMTMVDRQQNTSDADLQGKIFTNKASINQLFVKTLLPFANFRMNQYMRLANDVTVLTSKTASSEDRKIAAWSLGGYGVEAAMFSMISGGSAYLLYMLTQSLMGSDEDDEEEEKRINSIVKGQVTGRVTDLLSPLPILDVPIAAGVNMGLDKVQDAMDIAQEDKLSIYGDTKTEFLKSTGTLGISTERALQLYDLSKLAFTGEYTDSYGNEKKLSDESMDFLKGMTGLALLTNIGLAPSEANTVVKNAIRIAKSTGKTEKTIEREQETEIKVNKDRSILNQLLQEETDKETIKAIEKKISDLDLSAEERKEKNKLKKEEEESLLGEYVSKEQMKRYDPEMYEKKFGEGSKYYDKYNQENEVNKKMNELKRKIEDEEREYTKPKKRKKKETFGGGTFGKDKFGSGFGKGGF